MTLDSHIAAAKLGLALSGTAEDAEDADVDVASQTTDDLQSIP